MRLNINVSGSGVSFAVSPPSFFPSISMRFTRSLRCHRLTKEALSSYVMKRRDTAWLMGDSYGLGNKLRRQALSGGRYKYVLLMTQNLAQCRRTTISIREGKFNENGGNIRSDMHTVLNLYRRLTAFGKDSYSICSKALYSRYPLHFSNILRELYVTRNLNLVKIDARLSVSAAHL